MNDQSESLTFVLEPANNMRLANLCGPLDEHLRQIERQLGVEINNRGNHFNVIGDPRSIQVAAEVLKDMYTSTAGEVLTAANINTYLQ
ncbi:MAG TPA: phosphate starvation-inducible protein PhoH, partial [Gammaproteobacteria bacterium]|nr:phosphate starvation-inducible protein PhoH [Gammaproteobacteria bacterium]